MPSSGTSKRSSTRTRRSSTSARRRRCGRACPRSRATRRPATWTVEIKTKAVDALFPYQMLWFLVSSPAQWEKLGKDWNKFASEPSGTGPFKLARLVPRERAELVKNEGYWNPKRIPKTDRLVLIVRARGFEPHRGAALELGRHDRDAAARRGGAAQAGRHADRAERDAARLELPSLAGARARRGPTSGCARRPTSRSTATRSSSCLNGLATPAYGQVDRTSPWFGKPTFELKYAPDEARKLMTEAGFSKAEPAQDQVRRWPVRRHRPDAVAADERGDPGDVQGGLHRRRVQGRRARGAATRPGAPAPRPT